jgi:hypothetical protein
MQLVYMGFDQQENIRQYIFHRVAHGEDTRVFLVSTDLALFRKNHVGLQEGPAICLRVLQAELEAADWPQQCLPQRDLTDQHMQAYLVARGAASGKASGSRKRPLPS